MKVSCKQCGTVLDRVDATKMGLSYFCDRDHYFDHLKSKKRPASKSSGPDTATREDVLNADGHRCRYCGEKYNLHLHHVLYRSEGGPDTRENLITLCHKHHELVHSNKRKYQNLCLRFIFFRDELGDRHSLMREIDTDV